MKHALVLSVKVRRNERLKWLWQTLDIYTMFGQLLASKTHMIFNLKNEITEEKNCSPPDIYLPTSKIVTPTLLLQILRKIS